jgi:thiamine-phosphate pyrophosphorylase
MEVMRSKKLRGLYLVVAPILPADELMIASEKALRGGVDVVQFIPKGQNLETLEVAKDLSSLSKQFNAPFLINSNLSLAKQVKSDGLHFDKYDTAPNDARSILNKKCIIGYTLGNDLERLDWAEIMEADYVSFCSIFPTSSATHCNIVPLETIKAAKVRTTLSVFAAGGITPENAHLVLEAGADGIAVTSALLKAKDPEQAAKALKTTVNKYRFPTS